MSYQINEKLKFHKSEIDSLNSSIHVRGIPVELYWIPEPQPDKYEMYVHFVIRFLANSKISQKSTTFRFIICSRSFCWCMLISTQNINENLCIHLFRQ